MPDSILIVVFNHQSNSHFAHDQPCAKLIANVTSAALFSTFIVLLYEIVAGYSISESIRTTRILNGVSGIKLRLLSIRYIEFNIWMILFAPHRARVLIGLLLMARGEKNLDSSIEKFSRCTRILYISRVKLQFFFERERNDFMSEMLDGDINSNKILHSTEIIHNRPFITVSKLAM